jgi:hypothetical protein
MCSRLFPTYFSISFCVSGFMWRSLIHLDLSFVQRDKNGLIGILLQAAHQLNQHHLLKILSFFHWMILAPLSKIKWPKVCRFHFLVLNSIPLIHLPVTLLIACSFYCNYSLVQPDIRYGDPPEVCCCLFVCLLLIVENIFCYPRFFIIPNEFANCSF